MIYGTLEAGGTKMVLSIGNENNELLEQQTLPTESPQKTIPAMVDWFAARNIAALGIGTFGPVDLNESSPTYGYITSTPKPSWASTPLLPAFRQALNIPVAIDTDVNAAAIAEWQLGAAKGLSSCVYVTVGTGVGAGLIVNNQPVHGLLHPELGHMLLRAEPKDPKPEGFCPFHRGCIEGLASGPAMEKRWGTKAYNLPLDHPAWDLEAAYLAQMCMNIVCALSPEKIILGGGVMQQKHLFPLIRQKTVALLNNYVCADAILSQIDSYIVEPGLGTRSGAIGALLLARFTLSGQKAGTKEQLSSPLGQKTEKK